MESEGTKITKLLGAENWGQWKFQVSVLLRDKDAFKAVNGDLERPVPAAEPTAADRQTMSSWLKADNTAQKIIATGVADSLLVHIMNCNNAKDMWLALHNLFEQKSETSIHMIQQKWYQLNKAPKDSMAIHIAKLKDLAHRLQALGEPIADSMVMTKILMTLPPAYNHFITAWESSPRTERTLPNLVERLIAEETRFSTQEKGLSEALGMMKVSSKKKGNRRGKRGSKSSKEAAATEKGDEDVCFNCHKPGHWAQGCRAEKVNTSSRDKKPKGHAMIAQTALCVSESQSRAEIWYVDSGATHHMTNQEGWFLNLKYFDDPQPVNVGKKGESVEALGQGEINILAYDGHRWVEKHLYQVLFVPNLRYNLFSAGAALDKGLTQISTAKGCRFEKEGTTVAVGVRNHKLCEMQFKVLVPDVDDFDEFEANLAVKDFSLQSWHERLAHQNSLYVKQYLKAQQIKVTDLRDFFCEGCVFGKSHRQPFPKRNPDDYRSTAPGELVHSDLCGPFQEESPNGSLFFLLFKDDFSRYRTVYFLKSKAETVERIKDFMAKTRNLLGRDIQILRTDNGLEYVNREVTDVLREKGIQHQRTVIYTPQQNGVAERENRTLVEAMRTMVHARNLPLKLWAEGIYTAAYIINRTRMSLQRPKPPYEQWFGREAKLGKLLPFGTTAYSHIPKEKRKKLDKKAEKGYFVGYSEDVKAFRIWFPETDEVHLRRDVIFREDDHYSADSNETKEAGMRTLEFLVEEPEPQILEEPEPQILEEAEPQILEEPEPQILEESDENDEWNSVDDSDSDNQEPEEEDVAAEPQEERVLRDRNRIRRPSRYEDGIDPDTVLIAEGEEPRSYQEAIASPQAALWKQAMDEEIESLRKNNTWSVVPCREGRTPLENRWVYKIKRKPDGSDDKFKARLVAKGYTQKKGIDYHETFSPVVKFDSIRVILALAASKDLFLQQFDIKTAFLNGKLSETIYMQQPEGYRNGTNGICKLERSLYGLKQASRCWHERFTDFLKRFNLKPTRSDPCVFTKNETGSTLILAIYIDDGLIAASNQATAEALLTQLNQEFEVTKGNLSLFLGFQIDRGADGSIFLHQTGYAKKVLERFKMDDANEVAVPMDKHQELSVLAHGRQESSGVRAPYREAVGSLMYLAIGTRPDIAFALSIVSQYLELPDKIHWNAVKRILKYLKGTVNYGVFFKAGVDLKLVAFSDADFAGDVETRRSTTGYVFKFGDGTISWCSRKQKVVALSTTESEYIAAAETIKELIWLKRLITEITGEAIAKPAVKIDNQSAIDLLKNPEFHQRSKHIDVKYHFARDLYRKKLFNLIGVSTKDQQADIFTKPLAREQFCCIRKLLNIVPKA